MKMIQIDNNITSLDRVVNLVPELFDRLAGLIGKEKKKESPVQPTPCSAQDPVSYTHLFVSAGMCSTFFRQTRTTRLCG